MEALLHVPGWAGPAWVDTADLHGGFKKLHHFPNVALAVSKEAAPLPGATWLEAPAGWHWGSRAEVAARAAGSNVNIAL